jgi:hypothetical protein
LALQLIRVERADFRSVGPETGHYGVTGQRREGSKQVALFWPNRPFHILVVGGTSTVVPCVHNASPSGLPATPGNSLIPLQLSRDGQGHVIGQEIGC